MKKEWIQWKMELEEAEQMKFIAGMRKLQEEMIELLVSSEEHNGFPEATKVIEHIQQLGK